MGIGNGIRVWDGKGFLFKSLGFVWWGAIRSSLRDQDFMKTVLGLLSAIHQLHHGGGDFASML